MKTAALTDDDVDDDSVREATTTTTTTTSTMTSPPPTTHKTSTASPMRSTTDARDVKRRRRNCHCESDVTAATANVVDDVVVDGNASNIDDGGGVVIVHTTFGPIRGQLQRSYFAAQPPFYSFRSVPYARPPLGALRFRDPQPPEPWTQPLDARHECVSAPQYDSTDPMRYRCSEDCLVLNVYTNALPDCGCETAAAGRPVMVWLHGGTFRMGSASEHMHGPDFLLASRHNVVVVTVNYRLGALGFLSLADPSVRVPGNAGLKDQSLALRWVQANVAAFGGDAQNVTLFGNSAGACAVHLHMLSDLSAGLFQRAIVQSGTALAEWADFPKRDWARRLAVALGWQEREEMHATERDAAIYAFLCTQSAEEIVAHQDTILTPAEQLTGIFAFGPARENYVAEQSFFVERPQRLARAGRPWSHNVALMIGSTADEGLLLYQAICKNPDLFVSRTGLEAVIPASHFGCSVGDERSQRIAGEIQRYYYGEAPPTADNAHSVMRIWGDRFFWHSVQQTIQARLADHRRTKTQKPTFLFRYACESTGRFKWKKEQFVGVGVPGAAHADEVHYLFRCAYLTEALPADSAEMRRMRQMVGMWTQFAATGDPNCVEMEMDDRWLPVTGESDGPFKCLEIGDAQLRFIDLPESERIGFWEELYRKYSTAE